MKQLEINGKSLTIEDVISVARNFREVQLSDSAKDKMLQSQQWVANAVKEKKKVYGITTGFGAFQDKILEENEVETLQRNLILSHCVGVGDPFDVEVVRAMMLLRANALAAGFSGVRIEVVEMLLAMLNLQVHPYVPTKGSVGASGDLAPLSHIAAVMLGEGDATVSDGEEVISGADALEDVGFLRLCCKRKKDLHY